MKLLTFCLVAVLLQISTRTIADWAYGRRQPPPDFPKPVKLNRLLRYRQIDIEAWVANLAPLPEFPTAKPEADSEVEADSTPTRPRKPGRPRKGNTHHSSNGGAA